LPRERREEISPAHEATPKESRPAAETHIVHFSPGLKGKERMKKTTIVSAGQALVGEDLRPVDDALITIEDTRVVAIEAGSEAPTVDASSLTVLPGFIDAHVHIGFYEPAEVVLGGVTTVRDLGWPPDEIFSLAQRSRAASFRGPTILAAGAMLTAPGGYPAHAAWAPAGTAREVAGPDEAQRAVAETAERGACVVKVALNPPAGPSFDRDTLSAIVDASHHRRLKVTGHVYGLEELDKALDCGMDELAHMLMSDEAVPPDTIARMVAAGMGVVPTLSCRFGRDRETAVDNLARFVEAGGEIIYGTDLGNEGPRPGIDPRELEGLQAAGLTSERVISSATTRAAGHLGLPTSGTLAEGMDADLIGVAGDPLEDVSHLTRVEMVFRKGVRIR
jgi:imidazolonepropionase-like amidohydrolase